MICSAFESVAFGQFNVVCQAPENAAFIGGLVAGFIALVQLAWVAFRVKDFLARVGGVLGATAALSLGLAAGLPELSRAPKPTSGGHVTAVIDASGSVRRNGDDAFQATREKLAEIMAASIRPMKNEELTAWKGSVVRFGATANTIAAGIPLASLPGATMSAALGTAAPDTSIQAGLEAAVSIIARDGGAGAIWLLSDGNSTRGDIGPSLREAAGAGIEIHVFPVGVDRPAEGLLASNIGPDQAIGRTAVVRLTTLGEGELAWDVNGRESDVRTIQRGDGGLRGVHIRPQFSDRGINFVSLGFKSGNIKGQKSLQQKKRLFSLVRGPAQILVFGSARWIDSADPEKFVVFRKRPGDPVDPGSFDAVVIDGLEPSQFGAGFPDQLLSAAAGGSGVFIVNGERRGSPEEPQRMADWEETSLGPILPVNSDPELYLQEPPQRDILIIIDTSGSMGGGRLAQAKSVSNEIVTQLRSVDTIKIVPFASFAGTPFERESADANAIADARRFISGLQVGGGTNTSAALTAARALRGNNCALFIISDGEFPNPGIRPSCHMTAIGVDGQSYPFGFVEKFDQEIKLPRSTSLGQLNFEVFEPEERKIFWEASPMVPLANGLNDLAAPQLPISGLALGYARPEARVISIHRGSNPPVNPVLAFRIDPKERSLVAGVFMGAIPPSWATSTDGRRAVDAIMEKLISWNDPKRFDIQIRQTGNRFDFNITFLGEGAIPPSLGVSMRLKDGKVVPVAMTRQDRPGVFSGNALFGLDARPQRASLIIEESAQRHVIPAMLPARDSSANGTKLATSQSEALSYGVNEGLLEQIRATTGGVDLRFDVPSFRLHRARPKTILVWPVPLGAGLVLLASSLFLGGVRR